MLVEGGAGNGRGSSPGGCMAKQGAMSDIINNPPTSVRFAVRMFGPLQYL
jgi:hypothetical protein